MNAQPSKLKISDGTSQRDRFPESLGNGYVRADEMRFEHLLALGADYAGLLRYFNPRNQADGSWTPFFSSDALVIFSHIRSLNLKKIETAFLEVFLKSFDPSATRAAAVPSYQLAANIDQWFRQLKSIDSEAGQALMAIIQGMVAEKLRMQLQVLESFMGQPFIEREFDHIWGITRDVEQPPDTGTALPQDPDEWALFLKANFAVFRNAIFVIQENAGKLLPQALRSQIHQPHISLYVTFIKLYQKIQKRLNRFNARHLDFYYRDVLKMSPLESKPDRAYLKFDTDVPQRKVLVRAGTEFVAEADAGNREIRYTADNDLLVHSAQVAAIHTLFMERNPLISPEKDLGFITAAKINQIPVFKQNGAQDNQARQAWPILGAPKSAGNQTHDENARLGFAIADPVLNLKEGHREVTIGFKFKSADSARPQSMDEYVNRVLNITYNKDIRPIETETTKLKSARADVFFKLFRQMFIIQLTAEDGWMDVRDYLPLNRMVDDGCEANSLHIRFQLSPEDPAIIPYRPELHGAGYGAGQPILRFTINPGAWVYPYSLLRHMGVETIDVAVDVKGVKDIVAHNNLGPIDTNSPFYPFGPIPDLGSYFIVGNQEAAVKSLNHFDVEVEWAGPPIEKGDFKSYYGAYEQEYDAQIFKAGLSVLKTGKWMPDLETDQPRVTLFEAGPAGNAKKFRRLSCQAVVNLFKPAAKSVLPGEFRYDSSQKAGFFKLQLCAPADAFGHREYPLRLARVLTENAKLKKLRFQKPLPNPPYTPQINSIAIHYGASIRINFDAIGSSNDSINGTELYHIHPFGIERLSPQSRSKTSLVPHYDADGNLFIGLSPRPLNGVLALHFQLRDDSTLKSDLDPPALNWYFLSANRWERLDRRQVLSDSTNGFLSSGIVTLEIPDQPYNPGTIMPGNLTWLRVSLDHNPQIPCSLYAIHTHALAVSRQQSDDADASARGQMNLPAGTIKRSRASIAGIDRIVQIADSFGSRQPEGAEAFKTRISERLKHKYRASLPWDYERLILNRFPEIYKVKCFANMVDDPRDWDRSGHVLIVVIPSLGASETNLMPKAGGLLLKEIEIYLKKLSSPFAGIKVRNPDYEKIQVRCRVRLSPGEAGGDCIKRLNQALVSYLSPWSTGGYQANFGWCVRYYDITAFIRSLDYVNFVTDFSMLRVTKEDDGSFGLYDTAAHEVAEIHPLYPWSIAIPFKRHYIELSETARVVKPNVTGIDELDIGRNFIISGKQKYASKK